MISCLLQAGARNFSPHIHETWGPPFRPSLYCRRGMAHRPRAPLAFPIRLSPGPDAYRAGIKSASQVGIAKYPFAIGGDS